MIKCANCIYSEVLVKSGDIFNFINPVGSEVQRSHEKTVLLCRARPPITGEWPQVSEEDWCGSFNPGEEVSE